VPVQAVFGIDPNREPVDQYMACRSNPPGLATFAGGGVTIGNTIILPPAVGFKRTLLGIQADVVCSATVGNRILYARINDTVGGVIYWIGPASAAVTAAQTGGYDIAFPNGPVNTTVRRNIANTANTNVQVTTTCPHIALCVGVNGALPSIQIVDAAGIDAADAVTWRASYIDTPL